MQQDFISILRYITILSDNTELFSAARLKNRIYHPVVRLPY